MNNYLREYVDTYNPHEMYSNTYSLWQRSQYYDTNNLSLRNFISKERENPKKCDKAESSNIKNVRVITRNSLYEDPELFHYALDFSTTPQDPNYECYYTTLAPMLGENWMQDWLKVGESSRDTMLPPIGSRPQSSSRMQSYFDRPAMEKTVESMVQNVGWQGEDLAKTAERILEPIGTHTAFAIRPSHHKDSSIKPNQLKEELDIVNFNTNVLLNILEFVKNDTEIEIMFAKSLLKEERKRIHCVVNELINGDNSSDYDNVAQIDLVKKINAQNCYTLATLTEGVAPNRQVSVFKEAPSHIYLVTPDDLRVQRPPEVSDDGEDQNPQPGVVNPFLKSITKKILDLPNNKPTQYSTAVTNIIEYFREFSLRQTYTEFRFLGPFTRREVDYINIFLNLVAHCVENKFEGLRQDLVDIYKNIKIKLKIFPDVNGSVMLQKSQKEDKRKVN
ncbi:uncharacterized protein LOC115441600 [Manduca sexta]|uniref:uncharacterized protein LOC115441600 n=1 Tax=Manduca sexta TaxID=7130 RepID=UPI00188E90AD|nr:uncharacterized protein LOC115441600 [Manduca sexta]